MLPIDDEYRKVIVVGAKHTGKTSLMSSIVGGDFSRAYRPSARCQSFFDVSSLLELIDTPGLDDSLLSGTEATPVPRSFEEIRKSFLDFKTDPVVQEYITPGEEHDNHFINFDITQCSAYLIVYTDEPRSQRVAKALEHAILTKRIEDSDRRRLLFFLHHQGDFGSMQKSKIQISDDAKSTDEEKNDGFIELIYRDDTPIRNRAYHHAACKYLPNVSAQTGENTQEFLYLLRNEIDRFEAGGTGFTKPTRGANKTEKKPEKKRRTNSNVPTETSGGGGDTAPQSDASDTEPEGEGDIPPLPPMMRGQQRATCTNMTAAACEIQ